MTVSGNSLTPRLRTTVSVGTEGVPVTQDDPSSRTEVLGGDGRTPTGVEE